MSIDGITPPRRFDVPGGPKQTPEPDDTETSEPAFQPPEVVAAQDTPLKPGEQDAAAMKSLDLPPDGTTAAPSKKPRFGLRFHITKKRAIVLGIVGALVLGGGGVGAYFAFFQKDAPPPVVKKEAPKVVEPPKPTTVASPLTGVQVQPELAQLPVTGIMIENSPDARPQAGLKDAGIVYEAIAEGGITRFLALFQESKPDYIGPIRSARPYYVEWAQGYDAALAHVGGSPEALALIKSSGTKDLDQFVNSSAYQRISSRYAPHNVYSSIDKLLALQQSKGFTKSTFTGFARKGDKPAETPNASSIDLTLSGYLYNVHYDYDKASNSYKRVLAGKPHVDDRSGAQLQPKVVVALVVPYGIKSDGLHSDYKVIGSGKAFIFQDGTVTAGTWSKSGMKDPVLLGDANGSPIGINVGQTWVTAVGTEGSVAYK